MHTIDSTPKTFRGELPLKQPGPALLLLAPLIACQEGLALLLDIRPSIAMLHVAHTFTQDKPGGTSTKKRSQWPELALQWISADGGQQLSMWDRLPFCPPYSWPAAIFSMTKASRSPSSSPTILHPHEDESCETKQNCEEGHVMVIKEDKDNAMSSGKAPIRSFNSAFASVGRDGGAPNGDNATEETVLIGANDVVMDVRIWSSLPEDIIEKVLAWLPLTSVLRFRAVCRRWNSVLLSGRFLSSHSKSSPRRQPCFLLCTIGQFACTYDPSLGKWLTLLKPTSPGASVIASTGSLLCLGNQVTECRVLSVYNPITRSLRHLPEMSKLRLIHKITMLEDRCNNSYTIVVAGEDGLPMPNPHNFSLVTEVFDSRCNAWHAAEDPLPEAKFGSDPGVWFEGTFYCLTELPYGMVKFCPEEGTWEEVSVVMPLSLSAPSLVTARSRMMMVGRCKVDSETGAAATTVRIWELVQRLKEMSKQEDGSADDGVGMIVNRKENAAVICGEYEWMEVMEMPRSVSNEFLAPLASYAPFVCVGVGSCIFITTHLSPKVLVLDLSLSSSDNCWSWLPQDPLFPIHRDFHLLGFSFEPRFDATP
ncbi:hypothetical protein GOP47_0016184 [Adiantum capillus-veneris]|uniref:F-box domain-containing protein n=1 Tax=Adiantum capillus-veneris TaxID=13818 RepID=A0A9D4UL15_ADICA|nr:hypothetical protein GOP47_0016184 [Adiantum capillus-veneris]